MQGGLAQRTQHCLWGYLFKGCVSDIFRIYLLRVEYWLTVVSLGYVYTLNTIVELEIMSPVYSK